jgi:hypothetical protein
MINKTKLKKMYDNKLLNQSIIFVECKPFIIKNLKKGYSYEKTLKLLEVELKSAGINIDLSYQAFYQWKERTNKFTGKKNLDKTDFEKVSEDVEDINEDKFEAVKKTSKTNIFKNLKGE